MSVLPNTIPNDRLKDILKEEIDLYDVSIPKLESKKKCQQILYSVIITTSSLFSLSIMIVAAFEPMTWFSSLTKVFGGLAAFLTTLSAQFQFSDNIVKYNNQISKVEKLRKNFKILVNCNGDLTQEQKEIIIRDIISCQHDKSTIV